MELFLQKRKTVSKSRFLKLLNGAIINLDDLQMVLRQNVNEYAFLLKDCRAAASGELSDVKAVEKYLEDSGQLTVVQGEEMPPTKLVIQD